jgi:hypothetical protein
MTATHTRIEADVAGKRARAATDPKGPTGRLATWLANTTLDDIPASAQSTCCSTASPAPSWVLSYPSPAREWKASPTSYDQLPVDDRLTTRVRLTLKDGGTRAKIVAHPRGTDTRMLTGVDIVDKYRSLTRSVITNDRQTAIEKAVLSLDALDEAT